MKKLSRVVFGFLALVQFVIFCLQPNLAAMTITDANKAYFNNGSWQAPTPGNFTVRFTVQSVNNSLADLVVLLKPDFSDDPFDISSVKGYNCYGVVFKQSPSASRGNNDVDFQANLRATFWSNLLSASVDNLAIRLYVRVDDNKIISYGFVDETIGDYLVSTNNFPFVYPPDYPDESNFTSKECISSSNVQYVGFGQLTANQTINISDVSIEANQDDNATWVLKGTYAISLLNAETLNDLLTIVDTFKGKEVSLVDFPKQDITSMYTVIKDQYDSRASMTTDDKIILQNLLTEVVNNASIFLNDAQAEDVTNWIEILEIEIG